MVIAYALFDLYLPGCRGLKEKRMIVKSLKSRIRNEFEISAAEVAHQDLLQRAVVGLAAVGADREAIEPLLAKVTEYVERYAEETGAEIASFRHEFLAYGDVGSLSSSFGAAGAPPS